VGYSWIFYDNDSIMITTIFLYLISFAIQILALVFSVISFVIPNQFQASITYFLSHFNYVRGFFDVDTLFAVMGTYLTFLGFMQIVKLGLWVWNHLPWIGGKDNDLPSMINRINMRTDFMEKWNKRRSTKAKF